MRTYYIARRLISVGLETAPQNYIKLTVYFLVTSPRLRAFIVKPNLHKHMKQLTVPTKA